MKRSTKVYLRIILQCANLGKLQQQICSISPICRMAISGQGSDYMKSGRTFTLVHCRINNDTDIFRSRTSKCIRQKYIDILVYMNYWEILIKSVLGVKDASDLQAINFDFSNYR